MEPLHHREQGSGPSLILIHGFPMNQQIWNDFAEKLSANFKVVTIDLPGFGKSQVLPDGFSIRDVASVVRQWILENKYSRPVIAGHSLGGYVALALADIDPELMSGLCLFHSTAMADSQEKKASRNKVLEFIEKQGVHAFTSNFIGQLYADPQHSSITRVKNIAVQSSQEAVTGYTKAMRDRPDMTALLRRFPKPILFISGEKDSGIPAASVRQQAEFCADAEVVILPEVAHMGMFESEGLCLKKLGNFVEKCGVTLKGNQV
jgi:pimeloyl-ACP methyl ester carboxylesterase